MQTPSVNEYFKLLERNCPGAVRMLISESEGEFFDAVEVALENAIQHMESGMSFYCQSDERALTHVLVGCLGGGGVHVQNEAQSNGHVDVTIVHPLQCAWRLLGECKIYGGPQHHVGGCAQLLQRYVTGRMPATFCLEFVRVPGIRDKMLMIRNHMDQDQPLGQQGLARDHRIRWAFITSHAHSSGDAIQILHLGCNLHRVET